MATFRRKENEAHFDANEAPHSSEDSTNLIAGFPDVSHFSQHMLSCMLKAVQSSNVLPQSGDDFDYFTSYEPVREMLGCQQTRILQGMQELLRHAGVKGNLTPGNLRIDSDDRFDCLIDANDQLLERVGTCLDEAQGHRKPEQPLVLATNSTSHDIATAWNKTKPNHERKKSTNFKMFAARYVQRPQLKFKDKIDNSNTPFCPIIKKKPNALKSLEESLQIYYNENDLTSDVLRYPHPYQYELEQWEPIRKRMELIEPEVPKSLSETPFVLVDTVEELEKLVDALKNVDAFACDLEHHSYRSFLGVTCLMQISTEDGDWLIDTLALRSEMHILNDIFSDPSIVKVFHGADMDIQWLQRDFGIYVVNMFDTGQASHVLCLARHSLAHLLDKYCKVEADKQYQLADWRIRPLPEELIRYAREDTHYLLYIYAKMKYELLERGNEQQNLLVAVLDRSRTVCLQKYEKPAFTENSYLDLYYKSRKVFNGQQLAALKGLYAWRDKIGRLDDESTGYIMPNHMLLQVAEILPKETAGIIAVCDPLPPPVRQYLSDVHRIVQEARKVQPGKVPNEVMATLMPAYKPANIDAPAYNAVSLLNFPHDWSHDVAKTREFELDPSLVASESALLFGRKTPHGNASAASFFSWRPNQVSKRNLRKVQNLVASVQISMEKYCKPVDAATWLAQMTTADVTLGDVASANESAADGVQVNDVEDAKVTEESARRKWSSSLTRKRSASPEPSGNRREKEVEEEPLSVRNQYKKAKVDVIIMEKAATSALGKELIDSTGKVNKSAIEAEVEARLKEFKAFDYGNSDYSMFESEKPKKNKKNKKKDFEPAEDSGFKSHAKFKTKGKTGKSMSYTTKYGESSGLKWPKNKR